MSLECSVNNTSTENCTGSESVCLCEVLLGREGLCEICASSVHLS